jgi:hypothetical protein
MIVFDEIHTYTGTFGTHIYYFLRRLERILQEGLNVQYIAASATIGNPVEFTSKLFMREMVHVDCTTPTKNTTELYCVQLIADKFMYYYDNFLKKIIHTAKIVYKYSSYKHTIPHFQILVDLLSKSGINIVDLKLYIVRIFNGISAKDHFKSYFLSKAF